jgi:hypothetical protein
MPPNKRTRPVPKTREGAVPVLSKLAVTLGTDPAKLLSVAGYEDVLGIEGLCRISPALVRALERLTPEQQRGLLTFLEAMPTH